MQTDFTSFLDGALDPSNIGLGEKDQGFSFGSIGDTVKSGFSAFNSVMLGVFGDDQKAVNSVYAAAIFAGANAILQSNNNDAVAKFKNADREDTQAFEKELLTEKYKREDEARARKNAVPTRAGQINYNPNATRDYRVPGAASTTRYGLLGKA